MPRIRWGRLAVQFVANVAVFVGLVYLVLWLSGAFLKIQRTGGDQSQGSPIDATPALSVPSLERVDWPEVRNVVLIIGDGIGFSQVAAARSELRRLNEKLFFERFPITGWHTTHSLEAVYTDSAASASSLATGRKVQYLAVSATAEGQPHRTVLEAARDRGLATGVLTDSYLWDATPAAFLAHSPTRRNVRDIASQMSRSGVEILVGEEHPRLDFDAVGPGQGTPSLERQFSDAGFRIARDAEALAALDTASQQPILGLFPSGEIADPEIAPRLPELAAFALARLSQSPDGFFLVVETEEADTGGHLEDLRRIVAGVEAIDRIAAMAVEHALSDRATLVLLTADHETGGMAILHGDKENRLGLRWATSSHSGEPVPIYAFGAGAERFSGVKDNTDIARILSDLLDLGMFD